MFDYDGDGDIDQFDEEMTEYELQLMEDEIFFEDFEGKQYQKERQEDGWEKSCGLGVLIAIGIFVLIFIFITLFGS